MKRILKTLAILLFSASLYAQEDEVWQKYKEAINGIFSEIPKNQITTGLLIEKAIPFVNVNQFAGSQYSDTCDFTSLKKIYKQFCMAHYDYAEVSLNKDFLENRFSEGSDEIPIGIMAFAYNQINAAAINSQQIQLDSIKGKIVVKSGMSTKILDEKVCFAVSPLVKSIPVGTYNFSFSKEFLMGNLCNELQDISVDFGDGKGSHVLRINEQSMVMYDVPGKKTIQVKAKINGQLYYAFGEVHVVGEETNLLKSFSFGIEPDYGPIEFTSDGITAEYAIYSRCNGDGTIRKPYMIVSGFDPMDKNRLVDENGKVNLYRVSNKNSYLDKLRNDGFDIVIYRSKNSGESIIDNGLNLVSFIQKINTEKTSNNQLIIAGASMGGLVVRYALTYMEYKHIDHQTALFVSVDSPQEGANVPLGIQYMVKYLNKDAFDLIEGLEEAEDKMLNSVAAKEMLLYHHSGTSGNTAGCATERDTLKKEMARIGNFPKQCRTIGLSMGSGVGESQGFNAGDLLLRKKPSISWLVASGTLLPRVTWEFSVYAVPNQTSKKIYTESVELQSCMRILNETFCTSGYELTSRGITVNNTAPIDNAPGSIQNLHNTKSFRGQGEFLGLDYIDLVSYLTDFSYDSHPDNFIPAYSSLGLQNVSDKPQLHIKNDLKNNAGILKITDNQYINTIGDSYSLFDVLYIEDKNLDHIYDEDKVGVFSDEMTSFMSSETSPSNLFVENEVVAEGKSKDYEARNSVIIGEDVDALQYNNGAVSVHPESNVMVRAGNNISLKPGLLVEKGSHFKTEINPNQYCDEENTNYVKSWDSQSEVLLINDLQEESEDDMPSLIQKYAEPVILYPNPVDDRLTISSNKTDNIVTIYTVSGKKLLQEKFCKNTELDVARLQKGMYIVKVKQGDGTVVTKQIIKQ